MILVMKVSIVFERFAMVSVYFLRGLYTSSEQIRSRSDLISDLNISWIEFKAFTFTFRSQSSTNRRD